MSRCFSSAAYVPSRVRAEAAHGDDAPLAYLVDRIGPSRAPVPAAAGRRVDQRILMAVMMILLCLEWGSRRLRGLA